MLHDTTAPDRRAFLQYFSAIGLGATLLPGVLWAKVADGAEITTTTIAAAEEVAGVKFDDAERAMMVESLKSQESLLEALHKVSLPNEVAPALVFDPRPPAAPATRAPAKKGAVSAVRTSPVARRAVPSDLEELAFLPVTELAALVKSRRVSSLALTEMYLGRLKKYDPLLHCVVTLTEERALKQARAADAEIKAGRYRGPLHGIPWGAKDLFAAAGYPTTWGTTPYKEQMIAEDAEVVKRLDAAGAVLVAKLTLGELAMGDVWFGGMTRNPWKPEQGSSGSSAGPASATAAGLVAFALGTETLGSISSPSTRCGTTGLRPTFGRVPRTGAMALSWSMDKAGPICRSVEDCALVLDAIRGPDGRDPAAAPDAPFAFDASRKLSALRIGYQKSAFERDEKDYPNKAFDAASLDVLRSLGAKMTAVELPDLPYAPMRIILTAEGAAAFDELTRSGRDKEMAAQEKGSWPNTFRTARFIPAVDYVNANRLRSIAIREWGKLMADYDVIVTPTEFKELVATNLTGHPAVILPNGFRPDGTPVSLTFLGQIDGEGAMLEAANAYQRATEWNKRVPVLKV